MQLDPEAPPHILVEPAEGGRHGQRRAQSALRVVLPGLVQTEHRHHRVADELLDDAAVGLDGMVPGGETGLDHLPGVLRVELARDRGEADEVREEHGHELAGLGDVLREQCMTTFPQGGQGCVDDVVTERRALPLERDDRQLDRRERAAHRLAGATVDAHPFTVCRATAPHRQKFLPRTALGEEV